MTDDLEQALKSVGNEYSSKPLSSTEARRMVASGDMTAERAVSLLSAAGMTATKDGVLRRCAECESTYVVDVERRVVNTCSEPCQRAWNEAMVELDGGRTIILIEELTPARASELLRAAGLGVESSPVVEN